jgi:predicted amidohydrolase
MQDLRIILAQTDLKWEDPAANRHHLQEKLSGNIGRPHLIVLPEMFTTAFSMRSSELAERMEGPTVEWMATLAKATGAVLYGSLIIEEGGSYYNRGIWMRPDGSHRHYDKRHLFRMANETDHFDQGAERVVVELKGWRFLLQICYDLRFPVFSRNQGDYDGIIYVANWPEARRAAWSKLLLARAIENQAWVVGVNRVGSDANDIQYTGDSVLVDPYGEVKAAPGASRDQFCNALLEGDVLPSFRERFPVAKDADLFELKL